MILHIWSVLCVRDITDRDTGQLSLIDVVERITVTRKVGPDEGADAFGFSASLVSFWGRSDIGIPESGRSRVRLLSPDGTTVGLDEGVVVDVDLTEKPRYRTHIKLTALPMRGEGRYTFRIEVEREGVWLTAALVPYELIVKQEAAEDTSDKEPRAPRGRVKAKKKSK